MPHALQVQAAAAIDVIGSISLVERVDDGDGFGIGTKWRETRTMFGKQATEVMEVTEFEAGVRYVTAVAQDLAAIDEALRLVLELD